MRCRSNWDSLSQWINPCCTARFCNKRKPLCEVVNLGCIQIHMIINACRCLRHSCTNCRSHNIARRKIFLCVNADHDSFARCIKQHCAFTAHCFTDQHLLLARIGGMPQHGWMKLHKFKIAQCQSRTQGKRMSIAGYCGRIRGAGKHLPVSACCNYNSERFDNTNTFHVAVFVQFGNSYTRNLTSASV